MTSSVLIAGLGNPEKKYFHTRHNIGFLTLDTLALQHQLKITSKKFDSLYTETALFNEKVILVKPFTYMNLSGQAIQSFCHFYKIPSQFVIIIHDEVDLPFGEIRTKSKGSHAGHNGIKSIMAHLNTDQFYRIRIGIGRPENLSSETSNEVSDYVLSPFSTEQKKELPNIFKNVQAALEKIFVELKSVIL